jgi:hypothetical protein
MFFLNRTLITLVLTLIMAVSPLRGQETTRHYHWLTAGKVSGSLLLTIGGNGARSVEFQFNDRGRGPKIREISMADESGLLSSLEISGHSYMGAPADETFRSIEGKSSWKSTLEQGRSDKAGFYVASDGTPEQMAMLVRALLISPDHSLPLLPGGRASLEALDEVTLSCGAVEKTVRLYSINGLSLDPEYLWIDSEGELFALALGWMGMTPENCADSLPQLQSLQDRAEQEHLHNLSRRLTEQLPERWMVRRVSVLDVERGLVLENQAVIVQDGVIEAVTDDAGAEAALGRQEGGRVIDGQGMVLMPGLWDMHTHLFPSSGLQHIAAGVTTVRDLGNDPQRLQRTRTAFDSGEIIGPRSIAAGFIDKKSPYSAPTGQLARSLDDALAMVQQFGQAGYPQVKIYSSIEPEWVKPIAQAVHQQGMRLSGHIPSFMTAEQAVNDGYDEIQHINMLFLNFLAGPEDDTRTPVRFSLVAEKAGSLDLSSAAVSDFVRLLKDKGVVVDPTVTIFDSMFRHRSGELDPSFAMIADHMPPSVRRGMLAGDMDINEGNAARYARSADALLEMIALLHEEGVTLVAGTDNMAGFSLHRELELYHRAGISSAEVLRLATLGSARVAGMEDTSGSISPGKYADFVLLPSNPLQDIAAIRSATAVFKGDRWFDTARLYEAVGIRPFSR